MQIKKIRKFLVFLTSILYLSIFPVSSQGSNNCSPIDIEKAERYLGGFEHAAISFTQVGIYRNKSEEVKGILLIEKPGKFRMNYDSPHPLVIVGGGKFISIYDYDLDELSRIEASDNIFKFLLYLNLKIEDSVKIESCVYENAKIKLDLVHKETEQKAQIYFTTNPISLEKMIIPDDGNNVLSGAVAITFKNVREVLSFNKDFFSIRDSRVYGAPKRYSSEEILKILSLK